MLLGVIIVLALILITVFIFIRTTPFGSRAAGVRLDRIENSPNYVDGAFQNQIKTTLMRSAHNEGAVPYTVVKGRSAPDHPIPTSKTKVAELSPSEDLVIWMGHSSLYIQLDGVSILVDPVFSDYASPLSFINRPFSGTKLYAAEDFGVVDILLITHDHYDHLDYRTVSDLRTKIKQVICPLGVGAHLERWGYDPVIIMETDWEEDTSYDNLTIYTLPARHFSGRSLSRNATLWASYLLQTPSHKIYLSGDTGYGPHFAQIGARFGAIDLAILENGQYSRVGWPDIHLLPEQNIIAAGDLNARGVLPIHAGKFRLSPHTWNEPYEALNQLYQKADVPLLTPLMGQAVYLDQEQIFSPWWR